MRWSQLFIPTLRDDPADAEAISHKLLVRAGFVRQVMAGVYSLLPLGLRVCHKIEKIVREEMLRIDAQELLLPSIQPAELWRQSGRWDAIGSEMFRLQDRKGVDIGLGMTGEEMFASLASELRSYKQLPQIWFQFQRKYRDEPRPKSGVLRVREFTMKDSYSLDVDAAGLDASFKRHFEAYRRIFSRCGFDTLAVEASSGLMGGDESVEFMVNSDAGEDWVAYCGACGYAANVEKAQSTLPPVEDLPAASQPEEFATPGVRTIDELAALDGGAAAEHQIKTLVYVVDGAATLLLLRGDHTLSEQKLQDATAAVELRPASEEEIRRLLGATAGSLGPVGVTDTRIIADPALRGRAGLVTGANRDGFHLSGVDIERDIGSTEWLDLREVRAGEACQLCDAPLAMRKTIEVGHIFKLGTRYSELLGATVQDEAGQSRPIVMGCYGLGIERTMAAIVESRHDESGMIWPIAVAPFEVVVTVINPKNAKASDAGSALYDALVAEGIEVLLDDRDERPGVKFNDAELIGIPYRVTVGPKGLEEGIVEVVRRQGRKPRNVELNKAARSIAEAVLEERALSPGV